MDSAAISAMFAQLDRELWLLTAAAGSRRGGLVATFVSQASIVPEMPRVLVGVARQHYTWELIETSGAFALHLVGEEQVPWVWRFALHSGRDGDKLEGLTIQQSGTGSPLLADALGWLDCRIETRMNTGDRTVYLAEILDGRILRRGGALTLQRLLQRASSEHLGELREQMAHDRALDASAIEAWRKQAGIRSDDLGGIAGR
jgi:flavin reductase (DIM6/NTAB) family NADH-FMN oxidoreductase RutF